MPMIKISSKNRDEGIDRFEIEHAIHILEEAEKIMKNDKLMAKVGPAIKKKKDGLAAVERDFFGKR